MTEKLVIAKPHIVTDQEEDGAVLFDPIAGRLVHLNETAAFLYSLLNGRHSVENLVDSLSQSFAITNRAQTASEIAQFLRLVVHAGVADEC